MTVTISKSEKTFIEDGIDQDIRNDGRQREDYRDVVLEQGLISQAAGSARVQLGGTDVLVGIKAEIGAPSQERPGWGQVHYDVNISATADPTFEGRGGEELGAELGQALTQLYSGSADGTGAALAPKALGLVHGHTCWIVYISALVLSNQGNILDAIAVGVKAALADTRIPRVSVVVGGGGEDAAEPELDVDEDPNATIPLDMDAVPLVVTLNQCAHHHYVDATLEEEALHPASLSIAVNGKGSLVGAVKRGPNSIHPSLMTKMMEVAQKVAGQLHRAVEEHITDVHAEE